MIFARKVEFDWSNKPSSAHDAFIYDTPFGLWIAEIDKEGAMLSLKPCMLSPYDMQENPPLPFYEIPTKIKPIGTPFQMSVWEALTTIPYGRTTYYSAIAAIIHTPFAARAVGSAIGCNKIIGFIPCNRVLPKDGTLYQFQKSLSGKTARFKQRSVLSYMSSTDIAEGCINQSLVKMVLGGFEWGQGLKEKLLAYEKQNYAV